MKNTAIKNEFSVNVFYKKAERVEQHRQLKFYLYKWLLYFLSCIFQILNDAKWALAA